MKMGLVFGSTTGNTEDAAEAILEHFHGHISESINVDGFALETLTGFDVLLIGVPTWDIGELQESWDYAVEQLEELSFAGTQIALFGDGDQSGYPDNFQDAMGLLRELFVARGAKANIGHWPAEGYDFDESKALINGKFCGLALDDLNQREQHDERISTWCGQVKSELGLS